MGNWVIPVRALKKKGTEDSPFPTAYFKPSESFYNKLLPVLRRAPSAQNFVSRQLGP